uniref:SKICH domain-containing protein n=1 Tax=Rhodnius prolixus TaxID=13249 RepID=T1HI15_RHOPR
MAEKSEDIEDMQSSLVSLDDFTHLSVDKYMTSSFTKSQYSQVIFHDLCDIYPTDSDIKCTYSLTDNVKPQAGDKIAIFKIGWLSVSDYITFVRAQVPENEENSILEVIFKAGTFPKKDNELYQLCYVTSGNVIAGASTPFSFRKPHESEFLAVEDPTDPGLVVFRSRVAQLQNDLDQQKRGLGVNVTSFLLKKILIYIFIIYMYILFFFVQQNQQKKSLEAKYDLLNDRFNILKKEFDKCEFELIASKEDNTQLLKKHEELITEKDEVQKNLEKTKNDLDLLRSLETELEAFKVKHQQVVDELEKQMHDLMKAEKEKYESKIANMEATLTESYNKNAQYEEELNKSKDEITSLMSHIQQLLFENKNLKGKPQIVEVVSEEAYENLKSEYDLKNKLIVELNKEKQILEGKIQEHNIASDNLMLEIGTLKYKLRELSEKHNAAMAESHLLGEKMKEADSVIDNMKKELDEQHNAMNKNPDGNQYLKCKEERDLYRAQFENLMVHHSKCDGKLHMQINELQMNHDLEKAELVKERTELHNKITELKNNAAGVSGKSSANYKDPASQLFEVISGACSHVQNVFEGKLNSPSNQQQTDNAEQNDDLEKQQLREKLKYLQQQKAELRENIVQEKHRLGELERILTETKEENAALKSRISVLEYELAMLKSTAGGAVSNSSSPAQSVITEQLDSLNKSIPIIMKFNDTVAEHRILEEKIQDEKKAKLILQSKVEFLLQEDAKMTNKLQEITVKYEQLVKEKELLIRNSNAESVEELQRVLEDNDTTISQLKAKLLESISERERMQKTINELRKELIGKISAETLSEYKNKVQELETQLAISVIVI